MKFLSLKNLAMTGALSVAGFGLVGIGAHAVFTQNTVSAQTITAGTMNVTLYSALASSGNNTSTITLTSPPATNSSFTTGDQLVTITNNGNIPVLEVVSTPGVTNNGNGNSAIFQSEVYLCETSSNMVIYNGLLSAAPAQGIAGSLAVGGTDNYTANIYAGSGVSDCGGAAAFAPSLVIPAVNPVAVTAGGLSNTAQGGVIYPTITVSYTG
jgi:hypothetical protein